MRFVVFGAGAIGTYIGGSLLRAGHPVVFVDTGETVARIGHLGLVLEDRGRTTQLPADVFASSWREAARLGPFDAGIFALKSYDTRTALDQLAAFARELPPLICVQNGVDNEGMIAGALGPDRVLHATVTSAIGRPAPGRVVVTKARGVGLEAHHPLSPALASAFREAGLAPRLYADPLAMKWSKLLTNLMANASSAILDMLPEEIFRNAALFALEVEMMRECLQVMHALRLSVVDLPRTPVRALAFAVERLPKGLAQVALARVVGGGRGGKMPSFYLDLQSGRGRTEVEWLNGAIVRAGAGAGFRTPVNAALTETLVRLARENARRAEFQRNPTALLQEVERVKARSNTR